jgi:glycosyltransferase involved in cell wall biosynthesis
MGIREDKIFFLPPFVDIKKYQKTSVPEKFRIAIVGRLDEVKGHKILIEATAVLKKKISNIEVIVAGREEGIKWRDLKAYAEELGVEKNIKYYGFMDDQSVVKLMQSSSIGVISSTGSEAVSRVALEWMAAYRPVVAANVGCLGEIVRDGENGFLVPPGDPEKLAEKLLEILIKKELNDKMADKARKYIEEYHSEEVYIKYLKEILK